MKPNVNPPRADTALESQTVEWTAAGQDNSFEVALRIRKHRWRHS